LGRKHFDWMVTHMADMTIRLAKSKAATADRYEWARVVRRYNTPAKKPAAKKSKPSS
jgi:hypothetical protein